MKNLVTVIEECNPLLVPPAILEQAGLAVGSAVEWIVESGQVRLRPVRARSNDSCKILGAGKDLARGRDLVQELICERRRVG